MKVLDKLLHAVGYVILAVVILLAIVFVPAWYSHDGMRTRAAAFQPGMTVEQVAEAFPTDFQLAYARQEHSLDACIDEYGRLSGAALDSNMPLIDLPDEGHQLLTDARQKPVAFERTEKVDAFLRKRQEWRRIKSVWSEYIVEGNHVGAVPFLRRGTASYALNDYTDAWLDFSTACHLGNKERCKLLAGLPKKEIEAFATEQQSLRDKAAACEVEVASLVFRRPEGDSFTVCGQLFSASDCKIVSRKELPEKLHHFDGRKWYVEFDYRRLPDDTPHFQIDFGRDGKVAKVEAH